MWLINKLINDEDTLVSFYESLYAKINEKNIIVLNNNFLGVLSLDLLLTVLVSLIRLYFSADACEYSVMDYKLHS